MFTGIIQDIGLLKRKTGKRDGTFTLEISSKKIRPKLGDSIAVNGTCLTVTKKTRSGFEVDVIPETLRITNIGNLKISSKLNLEPSLKAGDELCGHFVTGHVDAQCKILDKEISRKGTFLKIELPRDFAYAISKKGSVAINGVSLTVSNVSRKSFTIALIPFTLINTNLNDLSIDQTINLEIDLIARYLHNSKKYENRDRCFQI